MHELKYKVGQMVELVGDRFTAVGLGGASIGSVYEITDAVVESRTGNHPCDYQEYELDCGAWVTETDIEPVE